MFARSGGPERIAIAALSMAETMKVLLIAIFMLGVASPPYAHAQRWGAGLIPSAQFPGPMKKSEPPRGGQGSRGAREGRTPPGDDRRQGRMSDEERRGLHRDIDRANREIYKPAPGR